MKKQEEYEYKYLRFDHLNFKLAILQQLIFEKKVFKPIYDFGDFCSNGYAQKALEYFKYLPVPAKYAQDITEINVNIDDEIYYEIYPEGTRNVSLYINEISTREITQFSKLKYISFSYETPYINELKKQLRPLKIKVFTARQNGEKPISIKFSILFMILSSLIFGSLGGLIFYQRYKDVEVVFHESAPFEEDQDSVTEDLEDKNIDNSESTITSDYLEDLKKYLNKSKYLDSYIEEKEVD